MKTANKFLAIIFFVCLIHWPSAWASSDLFLIEVSFDKDTYLLGEMMPFHIRLLNQSPDSLVFYGYSLIENLKVIHESGIEYKTKKYMSTSGPHRIGGNREYLTGGELLDLGMGVKFQHGALNDGLMYLPPGQYNIFTMLRGVKSNKVVINIIEPSGREKEAFQLLMQYSELRAARVNAPRARRTSFLFKMDDIVLKMIENYHESVYTPQVYSNFLIKTSWSSEYKKQKVYSELLTNFSRMYPAHPRATMIQLKEFNYYKWKYGLDKALRMLDERIEANLSEELTKHAQKLRVKYLSEK